MAPTRRSPSNAATPPLKNVKNGSKLASSAASSRDLAGELGGGRRVAPCRRVGLPLRVEPRVRRPRRPSSPRRRSRRGRRRRRRTPARAAFSTTKRTAASACSRVTSGILTAIGSLGDACDRHRAAERRRPRGGRDAEHPARGEVRVRSVLAGVCRTDMDILTGALDTRWVRFPVIPGHEWSGVVDSVGEGVDDLEPGQRVVCEGNIGCMSCPRCRAGDTHLCQNYDAVGFTRGGGWGEFVVVPARILHPLPESRLVRGRRPGRAGLVRRQGARPSPDPAGRDRRRRRSRRDGRARHPHRPAGARRRPSSPSGSGTRSSSSRARSARMRSSTSPRRTPRRRPGGFSATGWTWSSRRPAPFRPSSSRRGSSAREAASCSSGSPATSRS